MSARGSRSEVRSERADLLTELAMPAHHIQLADPRVAASSLVDSADRLMRCVRRGDFWKDDPDIARWVNDRLAANAG